jgi:AAA domain
VTPTIAHGHSPSLTILGADAYTYSDIARAEILPPTWDVEPLIGQGQRVMVIGQWGAFKSWLLSHLALHLAAGCTWLDTFTVPEPRRVLYIDKEMSARAAIRRFQQLAKGAGIAPDANLPLMLLSHPPIVMNDEGAKQLLNAIDKRNGDPNVIITETFRRVLVGAEKEQADVSRFWSAVEPIFKAGKTTIFSHHMRKPKRQNENSREMASGSTDILASADGVLAILRAGLTDRFSFEHLKNREGDEYDGGTPFELSITFPSGAEKYTGPVIIQPDQRIPSKAPVAATLEAKAALAMRTFARGRGTVTTAELNQVGKAVGGSETACDTAITTLVGSGFLSRTKRGTYAVRPEAPTDDLTC